MIESGKGKSDPKQNIGRPDKPITVALPWVYSHWHACVFVASYNHRSFKMYMYMLN